jgi:hypothetical protein
MLKVTMKNDGHEKYLKGARKYQQEAITFQNYGPTFKNKKKRGGRRQWVRASLSSLQSNIEQETQLPTLQNSLIILESCVKVRRLGGHDRPSNA